MTAVVVSSRYRLEEQLAHGGMGAVWRGTDEVLGRPVAIKLLHEHLAADPGARARFEREARTAASLRHANMANVFDYVGGDRPGIVMELIDGETLTQRMQREGPLPVADAIAIAAAILDALAAAHTAGVVHRDVKPGNILLATDGTVKVTDFGIARAQGDATVTATAALLATPHYVAPEQLRGDVATPASDVYAAGIVLYEMLTGARAFDGDSAFGVAMARLDHDVPPLRARRPDASRALEQVVARATMREPEARFPAAGAMRAALDPGHVVPGAIGSREGTQVMAAPGAAETVSLGRPAPEVPRTWPGERVALLLATWARRHRRLLLPTAASVLLLATLVPLVAASGTVVVPTLTGSTLAKAERLADEAGLTLEVSRVDSAAAQGRVLAQDPPPDQDVRSGSTVRVDVSRGNLVLAPRLVGLKVDDAIERLGTAGLTLGTVQEETVGGADKDTVIGQSPARGETLARGDPVDLVIAREPDDKDDEAKKGKGNGRGNGTKGRDGDD